jgi:hypothetical protein
VALLQPTSTALAPAVMRLAHAGTLALAIVVVCLAITAADWKNDHPAGHGANSRPVNACAFHIRQETDACRPLAEFVTTAGLTSKSAALDADTSRCWIDADAG